MNAIASSACLIYSACACLLLALPHHDNQMFDPRSRAATSAFRRAEHRGRCTHFRTVSVQDGPRIIRPVFLLKKKERKIGGIFNTRARFLKFFWPPPEGESRSYIFARFLLPVSPPPESESRSYIFVILFFSIRE